MDLDRYLPALHEQLALSLDPADEQAQALAQRLTAPLGSSIKLMLLEVLSEAAAEITSELAPGAVEVRLRGGAPEFVVTPPPAAIEPPAGPGAGAPSDAAVALAGDGAVARINLRLPEELKNRVEQAAAREGLSVNAWLVRAAAAAAAMDEPVRHPERTVRGAKRYSGWVQ